MAKILRILNRLNVGGPTYNVAYLSKYLPQNFETKILAGIHEPHEASSAYVLDNLGLDYQYVPTMYRSIHPLKDFRAMQFIRRAMQDYQPDIVHTHAAKAGVLGRPAAYWNKGKRPKILHTYHGNVFDGYFSPAKTKLILTIERFCCRLSDKIIAISEKQKIDLSEKYRVAPAEKIEVVPLGFDLNRFTIDRETKRSTFRQEWGIQQETILITIVGRFAPVKNHLLFLEAFLQLKKAYPHLPVVACMVGDGELAESLLSKAADAGLRIARPNKPCENADVLFTSWRKDMEAVHAATDIAVLTSLNEGTPVSLIEAMAAGKAVVSTNVGGVSDVVKHAHTGMLIDSTINNLVNTLRNLVDDENLRIQLSKAGEKFVLSNYTYERLCLKMASVYDNLLK